MQAEPKLRILALLSPWLLVAILAATTATIHAWRFGIERGAQDFYQQPWAVPVVQRHAPERNIWDPAARSRMARWLLAEVGGGAKARVPLGKEHQHRAAMLAHPPGRAKLAVAGTPFFFALLSPFSRLDFDDARIVYLFSLFAALGAAILGLGTHLGLGLPASLVMYSIVVLSFEPFRSELRVWNVNSFLLACCVAVLRLVDRGSTGLAGALLACGVAFKPNLGPVAVTLTIAFAASRRWEKLGHFAAGGAVGGGAAFLLGCWWVGRWDAWVSFYRSLTQLSGDGYAMSNGNFSLGRWLLEATGQSQGLILTASAVAVGCVFAWGVSRAALPQAGQAFKDQDAAAIGVGIVVPLMVSPLAWLHYYTLLLFPAMVLLRPHFPGESLSSTLSLRHFVGALAILVLCVWPVWVPLPIRAALAKPFITNVSCSVLAVGMLVLSFRRTTASSKSPPFGA